jgi:succinate-semialdehyde dehydrogenase/glutarate-semialdehyde dehydrogenase
LMQGDTQAIAGLCAAEIDRLVFAGNAALGAQIRAMAEAAGKVFELQAQ